MRSQSYTNALYYYYYNFIVDSGGAGASKKKDIFFGNFPEFKKMEKFLDESNVIKGLFKLTMGNLIEHMPKNAIFYADKLKTLTNNDPIILYLLGECFFMNSNYKKIYLMFDKHGLLEKNDNYVILAAKGLIRNKEFKLCQDILEDNLSTAKRDSVDPKVVSVKYNLLAQCREENENKPGAIKLFYECLRNDPYCVEAFTHLMEGHTYNGQESKIIQFMAILEELGGFLVEEHFLSSIKLAQEDDWLKHYYMSYMKKVVLDENKNTVNLNTSSMERESPFHQRHAQYGNFMTGKSKTPGSFQGSRYSENMLQDSSLKLLPTNRVTPENTFSLLTKRMNLDILCIKAINSYAKYDINQAYELSKKVIEEDPLKLEILPVYCCCLLEKADHSQLYKVAGMLEENYPSHPISPYAIGLYLFLSKKYDLARKYFKKANYMDKNYIYSWIAMGHAFAIHDEADHAMGIYRGCQRLFPGSHLPHLYIGMEYLRTNNLETAMLSFQKANEINPEDPIVFNEIGVTFYKKKDYVRANENFVKAIRLCSDAADWILEDILCNLAHSFRKMGDFKNSIKYFEQCLTLNPKNDSVLFALAFTYHITHQLAKAQTYYFKMMNYQTENQFANEMLDNCLNDLTEVPMETMM